MSKIELARQKLIGMINRIDKLEEIQRLIDQLYEEEEAKKREMRSSGSGRGSK